MFDECPADALFLRSVFPLSKEQDRRTNCFYGVFPVIAKRGTACFMPIRMVVLWIKDAATGTVCQQYRRAATMMIQTPRDVESSGECAGFRAPGADERVSIFRGTRDTSPAAFLLPAAFSLLP